MLGQPGLSGRHLRVRYVFLPLPPAFADNQVVSRAVPIPPMTSTAGPGANREPLHPGTVQYAGKRSQFGKKPGSLVQKFFQSFV